MLNLWLRPVVICIVGAAIGSGITLLAKTGPEGPVGEQGDRGPRGPRGYAAYDEAGENAEAAVIDLEGNVNSLEGELEEARFALEELGGQVSDNTQSVSEICSELDLFCP